MSIFLFVVLILLILFIHSNFAETLVEHPDTIAETSENNRVSVELKDIEQTLKDIEEDTPVSNDDIQIETPNLNDSGEEKVVLHDEAAAFEEEDIVEKIVKEVKRVTEEQSHQHQQESQINEEESFQTEVQQVEESIALPSKEEIIHGEHDNTILAIDAEVVEVEETPSISIETAEHEEVQVQDETSHHKASECNTRENTLHSTQNHNFSSCLKKIQNRIRLLFEGFFSLVNSFFRKIFQFRFR